MELDHNRHPTRLTGALSPTRRPPEFRKRRIDNPTPPKIYTIIFKQPEKGSPLLEKAFKLGGDKRCLQALALAQMAMKDVKGMLAYKKHYVDHFETLSGSRVVCFYIAGVEKDGTLFNELLRKTPEEDIEKDKSLSLMIARTAKALVENHP